MTRDNVYDLLIGAALAGSLPADDLEWLVYEFRRSQTRGAGSRAVGWPVEVTQETPVECQEWEPDAPSISALSGLFAGQAHLSSPGAESEGHVMNTNENTNENTNTAPIAYVFGDRAAYTGKVVEAYGGTFYEVMMLEGHMAGQLKVVKQPPMPKAKVTK